jgi:RNA polymerase sigma-70 factor (ECF subfamily)
MHGHGFFEESTTKMVAAEAEERSMEQAQRDIYDSHRHRVFSLAYHMTGNELEAERILRNCFVRAFSEAPKPDGNAIDLALMAELRKHFPFTLAVQASPTLSANQSSAGIGGRNVRRTDLEEAIQELPPTERLLFLLRDVEGYTSEVIAQLLEMPQPQVNRTLFSARIRLRGILSDLEARRAA